MVQFRWTIHFENLTDIYSRSSLWPAGKGRQSPSHLAWKKWRVVELSARCNKCVRYYFSTGSTFLLSLLFSWLQLTYWECQGPCIEAHQEREYLWRGTWPPTLSFPPSNTQCSLPTLRECWARTDFRLPSRMVWAPQFCQTRPECFLVFSAPRQCDAPNVSSAKRHGLCKTYLLLVFTQRGDFLSFFRHV